MTCKILRYSTRKISQNVCRVWTSSLAYGLWRRYAAHSSHLEFGMCLGQEPPHCHTWHVHFHLSRWRCGQGESNICINQAGNWYNDALTRAAKILAISSKVSKRSKATRRQKSSKWSKALGFWRRPKFLKSGQNFRASKILPSDYAPYTYRGRTHGSTSFSGGHSKARP